MTHTRAQSAPSVLETVLFANADAAARLERLGSNTHVVSDPIAFRRLLAERPAVVVVFAPPATEEDIGLVAHERSARRDMRAVLVDRPPNSDERLAALRAGFDEAVHDDITGHELAGRISLLAEQARLERAVSPIDLGPGIALDLDARALIVEGQPVHLRPREFELLAFLAAHPGRTFGRQELLATVGAEANVRQQRSVDVHVRWLRMKLAKAGDRGPRLKTVRAWVTGSSCPPHHCRSPLTKR